MIQRLSPAVQPQKLKDVHWSAEIVERVERGMTRASTCVHDQPAADNATHPGKQTMVRDLERSASC